MSTGRLHAAKCREWHGNVWLSHDYTEKVWHPLPTPTNTQQPEPQHTHRSSPTGTGFADCSHMLLTPGCLPPASRSNSLPPAQETQHAGERSGKLKVWWEKEHRLAGPVCTDPAFTVDSKNNNQGPLVIDQGRLFFRLQWEGSRVTFWMVATWRDGWLRFSEPGCLETGLGYFSLITAQKKIR